MPHVHFDNSRKRQAETIICGGLRQAAREGDPSARATLFRNADPMQQADLLDRWGIPNDASANVDCLGEVKFD